MPRSRATSSQFLRFLFTNPVSHWIVSIVVGMGDALFHCVYHLFGLAHHPDFFTSWQATHNSFFPNVDIPLRESRKYLQGARSLSDPFAVYTAAIVFRYIPRSDAESALASLRAVDGSARLDSSLEDSEGRYPVCYCFGLHQNLLTGWMLKLNRRNWGIQFKGIDYSEVCIGIIGVKLDHPAHAYPGPFLFMPRLHLNRLYPTFLGWMVGLRKTWSRVSASETNYEVREQFSGRNLYRASFKPHGEIGPPERFANLPRFQQLLEYPMVSSLFGDVVYSYFDWGWEHSFVQPISGQLECLSDDIPCMPRGSFEFAGLDRSDSCAFRVHLPWELVAPFRRNELVKQTLDARAQARAITGTPPHVPPPQAATAAGMHRI